MEDQLPKPPDDSDGKVAALRRAAETPQPGFLGEFWQFLAHNKKWWLLPILLVLLVTGVLAALSATPLAPFIYTLF
jgi:hypothetical protein